MARRHGWGGTPPADEEEARQRIIEAAVRCIDRLGAEKFSLAEVATDLGVMRPTIYRYYPSADHLFIAVGQYAVVTYIEDVAVRLRRFKNPSAWVVEAVVFGIEQIPARPHLSMLLASGQSEKFSRTFTSPEAMEVGRAIFHRAPFDWAVVGYSARDLDDLIEHALRIIQSMIVNPPNPARSSRELRRCLRSWFNSSV
ncbi:hypothetical protein AWC29_11540 [Mycobacterium triplex]|uniref:Transcriptional regulator n=1 Tax=Mycobacterium triplex TaxID=47839 RepID=A0A024JZ69_9MYCO|nr:TetR/AcrR family transcriptional regulator [Mycobacterium triplex]ORX05091.1 hypothetical protein AWC29_11540 [Mycobacterium triplex]CDO89100.1 transcriptional regulator [Mycobacterium triplex]